MAGPDPRAFHAVGVAFHGANAVLLFILALGLFGGRVWPALVAAALFAVHPVNTEAVDFISARNNVTALAFMIVALVAFRRALRSQKALWGWIAAVFLFLGLASKEPAIMARLLEKTGREADALPHYEAFLRNVPSLYRELVPEARERLRALSGTAAGGVRRP